MWRPTSRPSASDALKRWSPTTRCGASSAKLAGNVRSFSDMKCPRCQGHMKQKRDMIEQDGVSFEAYACPKCGEELLTMPQLNALAEKYRKLRAAKEVTFPNCGNSI